MWCVDTSRRSALPSRKDIASFTGLPATLLAPVIERLPLRTFRDEAGGELLDVRGAPLPDADVPAPVRFLPTFDATLLVHARRTQILPERFRPLIFHTKNPQSAPTFLVDGQVAGTWKHEGGRIALQPFEPLPVPCGANSRPRPSASRPCTRSDFTTCRWSRTRPHRVRCRAARRPTPGAIEGSATITNCAMRSPTCTSTGVSRSRFTVAQITSPR